MFARCLYINVLILLTLRVPIPVQAFSCFCNTDAPNCVQNTCELENPRVFNSKCAVDIRVFNNNGSVQSVTRYCTHGFDSIACDTAEPYITYMYTEYHKCCKNQELCNRCLIPESPPYEVKLQIPLDPDCNITIPSPSPSPLVPPNTRSQSSELGYLYAAIAVGSISLLGCLVMVIVILVVWKRYKRITYTSYRI